jgi:hypothetical protein
VDARSCPPLVAAFGSASKLIELNRLLKDGPTQDEYDVKKKEILEAM